MITVHNFQAASQLARGVLHSCPFTSGPPLPAFTGYHLPFRRMVAAEDERRRASVKAPSAKRTRGPCKQSGEGKGKEKKKEENSGTVTMRSGHWTEEENIQFELGEAR